MRAEKIGDKIINSNKTPMIVVNLKNVNICLKQR